jgi:hypothetical protein
MIMKTNKLLIALSTVGALCFGLSGVAVAADNANANPQGTLDPKNHISVAGPATIALQVGTEHGDGNVSGNVATIKFTNNSPLGSYIKVFTQNSGVLKTGLGDVASNQLKYTIVAPATNVYTGDDANTESINSDQFASHAQVNVGALPDALTIYTADAGKVFHGNEAEIGFGLLGGESVDKHVAGNYSDTVTFIIANAS